MSFIALALTLCTAVGADDLACNTYMVDAFAGDIPVGQMMPLKKVSLSDQWTDCLTRLEEETHLARSAAMADRATRPSANDGQSTAHRQAYLQRFNIAEDVKSVDVWEYRCERLKESEIP